MQSPGQHVLLAKASGGTAPRPVVAILGAGFSGAATAMHLLRADVALDVVLVDRRGAFAKGLAYGTDAREHVLNVPAVRMSAFPDAPDDLLQWMASQHLRADPDAFLPRRDYGRYLTQRLAEAEASGAAHGATLQRAATEAVALEPKGARVDVRLRDGSVVLADQVVLALGNLTPRDPLSACGSAGLDAARYARDPWAPRALEGIADHAGVLVLGTGLTAIDVVLSLRRLRHQGPIVALSRRGLLPRPQRSPGGTYGGGYDPAPVLEAAGSLRRLLRTVRAEAERLEAAGGNWRDLVAALRPITSRLWGSLTTSDHARFLEHLRPFWDVHRHRMAPAVEDVLAGLWVHGAFVERAGRVLDVRAADDGVDVRWLARGLPSAEVLHVGRIVNATGGSLDLRSTPDPLVKALREQGWITPDPLGLGLVTETDGTVVPSDPARGKRLHALGPLRMGSLWESTAVPELRVQARDLAVRLIAALRG
jgi:uncharacterized NAD(P)/FAD-binding protein YdhS